MNGPAWSKHYRATYEERSGDRRLPKWLRVACLALGVHRANGHALFRVSVRGAPGERGAPGDLALVLGEVDLVTGEILPADRRVVLDAVDAAVRFGWLARGSSPSCLIVPAHVATYGVGNPHEPCRVDHTRARRKHDGVDLHAAA